MKFIAALFTFALITTSAHAEFRKDLYESATEEIQNYYSASGDWSVTKIKNLEEVDANSREFFIVKAKVQIQNANTTKLRNQTCLVTFVRDNYEFYGINCF